MSVAYEAMSISVSNQTTRGKIGCQTAGILQLSIKIEFTASTMLTTTYFMGYQASGKDDGSSSNRDQGKDFASL